MNILGIESSCDETAAAVVTDGRRILSNVVNSQIDIHKVYGGVVPEVAARSHLEVINPVINKSLSDAHLTWDDIDAIAVTYAPGLIGSLLVGTLAARTLAILKSKPLYPIHHIESHIYANFLDTTADRENLVTRNGLAGVAGLEGLPQKVSHVTDEIFVGEDDLTGPQTPVTTSEILPDRQMKKPAGPEHPSDEPAFSGSPKFPLLALVVSGGHTQIILLRSHGTFNIIGTTRDDAVGEVFDKVAKILGLPYPGGPSISAAALRGDRTKYPLPKAKLDTPLDFSFSGLKTAVLRSVQRELGQPISSPSSSLAELLTSTQRADFAASFERTAVDTLIDKLLKAYELYSPKTVVIAGGVSANQFLRSELARRLPIPIDYAPIDLCTDNAAMVASAGYYHVLNTAPADPYDIEVHPSLLLVPRG